MVATVNIQSGHGSSPGTWSNVSSVRFKNADDDTANTSNPLVKPTSNFNYSYEKVFRLNVTAAPDNNLTNLRFHRSSGTPSTGITDFYGERSQATGYSAPTGGSSTQSTIATTSMVTTATTLTNDNGTFSSTGMYGPYIYIQWRVGTTATAGTQNTLTYRWTFDES